MRETRSSRSAAIVGIGLFVVVSIGVDSRPDTPHQNRPVLERVPGNELPAASVIEGANQRLPQYAHLAVEKIHTPLVCLRVVKKQGHGLPVAFRAIRLDLFEPRAAAPYLATPDSSLDCDCHIALAERVRCLSDLGMPRAFAGIQDDVAVVVVS